MPFRFREICLVVFLLVFLVSGCAAFPDLKQKINHSEESVPNIVGARMPVSPGEIEAAIRLIERKAGPTDILRRHAGLMEEITGKPLLNGNKATLLSDGPETLESMSRAISEAKDHIHLETFIIRDDNIGGAIAELLLRKRAQGVRVKLIYDSFGCLKTPASYFDRLEAGGIEVYEFNPVRIFGVLGRWAIHNRDHRKILVVDGKIAFTGGINFYHVYAKSPSSPGAGGEAGEDLYWRDTHVRIEGPAVAEFQKLFLDMWNTRDGLMLYRPEYFPPPEKKGDVIVRVISSLPSQPVPNIYAAYLSAIMNAKQSIRLTHAYFLPGEDILRALSRSAMKGVDVKIILPSVSDFWMPLYAGRYNYSELLKSGVKLYERRGALLHSKTAVIDGVWSTVGSSNFDTLSFLHSAEVNAVVIDLDFARKMEKLFDEDLEESDEILLEQWKKRPFSARFAEWFAHLFKYWL